jgi:hypothetical protein
MIAAIAAILCAIIAGVFGVINTRQSAKMNHKVDTNHGRTIGQHVEDLVAWSHIHHQQDNEIRAALGLLPVDYPDFDAWRNR